MASSTTSTRPARLTLVALGAGLLLPALGCSAMHQASVQNLRTQGQQARADCYEMCGEADVLCMKDCDLAHPWEMTAEEKQQRELAAGMIQAAAVSESRVESAPEPSGRRERKLEINGREHRGGEHLGRPCSLDAPCPDGYSCHLVTSQSGSCVQ